jgi:hypothetical protein
MRRIIAVAAVLVACALPGPTRAATTPSWCLPPVFEGGERLHALPVPSAFWLPPLLRQHQLCHAATEHPDEPRAILIGNSAVLGFPLPVEATLGARLNASLRDHGVRGRVFNLGWVNAYQLRDAVILNAALEYRPDVIIYPLTLADFHHVAPVLFGPTPAFFDTNATQVLEMVHIGVPGLDAPLQRYEAAFLKRGRLDGYWQHWQEVGALARAAAHANATTLARLLDPTLPPEMVSPGHPKTTYDCTEVILRRRGYRRWQSWNILAYLQALHERDGIQVLVANWPMDHKPIGECYNARHAAADVDEFNRWLRDECAARGLEYVDLHDLLSSAEFFDSIHPTAEGHQRIAEHLAPAVEEALRARAAARSALR